jgi:hypothetical protein
MRRWLMLAEMSVLARCVLIRSEVAPGLIGENLVHLSDHPLDGRGAVQFHWNGVYESDPSSYGCVSLEIAASPADLSLL